jgi:nucleoside-diphosphate-sugar epimerase
LPCVLITGADGFVGKVLCSEFVSLGWKVRASVRSLNKSENFIGEIEIVETGSIGPDTNWENAITGIEYIVHLAGRVHVSADSSSDPLTEFRKVNTAGTEKLARSAASSGARRFIFMSTVKVNGEGKAGSYVEDDVPDPKDPYGISKWEAEKKIIEISRKTGMEVVIIRAPLVYGPGVKANFLKLLKAVDKGIPMPIKAINNRRSMIYLYNLTDLIVKCMTDKKASGKTYLASDGEDVSTAELVKYLSTSLGRDLLLFKFPLSLIKLVGKLTGHSEQIEKLTESLTIDSSLIRKELGWIPPFTLAQGLKETVLWYKKSFTQT